MCIDYFNKKIKKINIWDVSLTKLAVAAFVLFIVSILPITAILTIYQWRWVWLILFIIFVTKPLIKVLS